MINIGTLNTWNVNNLQLKRDDIKSNSYISSDNVSMTFFVHHNRFQFFRFFSLFFSISMCVKKIQRKYFSDALWQGCIIKNIFHPSCYFNFLVYRKKNEQNEFSIQILYRMVHLYDWNNISTNRWENKLFQNWCERKIAGLIEINGIRSDNG